MEIKDEILKFYSAFDEKNYYEILCVTKDSKKDEIKAAYVNLVKKFHPDANPDFEKDIRKKTEEIFVKITMAYQILSDNKKRAEYDSQIGMVELTPEAKKILYEAEIAYREGEMLLKQRKYVEAEQEFKKALNLSPNEAGYVGALAWAKFLGATDKNKVLDEVKKEFQRAIALSPRLARTYYYLGCVYKYSGSEKQAEANFLKALEYDPEYIEAKRELRVIEMRRREDKKKPKKDGGFWSNLFRK